MPNVTNKSITIQWQRAVEVVLTYVFGKSKLNGPLSLLKFCLVGQFGAGYLWQFRIDASQASTLLRSKSSHMPSQSATTPLLPSESLTAFDIAESHVSTSDWQFGSKRLWRLHLRQRLLSFKIHLP